MSQTHACKVDFSATSGSLVYCTCGYVVGPFADRARAGVVAKDHRAMHVVPARQQRSDEERQRVNARQREIRAERRRLVT